MINSLDKSSCCPEQDQCCEDIQTSVISNDLELTSLAGNEVLSSKLGHVRTDPRVTLKRVTHTSGRISTGKKITFVHSSTVSTTRSWSSPGVVTLPSDLNRHAVSGFNLLNKIPSSSDLFGWINDLNSLIKEKNIGFEKEQVSTVSTSATDSDCHQDISAVEEALKNKSNKESDQNPTASDGTTGSELFHVCHCASFSQMGSTK